MLRCDSARMSTSVTAPFGNTTWLVSSTWPPPAATAADANAVSVPMSATGDAGREGRVDRVQELRAGRRFALRRSCGGRRRRGSVPGMMWRGYRTALAADGQLA